METTRTARVVPRLFRWAVLCGGIPLAIGVTMFLLWLLSRDFGLVLLGLVAIPLLIVVLCAGLLALLGCGMANYYLGAQADTPRFRSSLAAATMLLAANFAAIGGIGTTIDRIEQPLRVEIRNESQETLRDVTLRLRRSRHPAGSIAPGETAKIALPGHRGVETLTFSAESDSTAHETLLSGYVTRDDALQSRFLVTVQDDGEVTFTRRPTGPIHAMFERSLSSGSASAASR